MDIGTVKKISEVARLHLSEEELKQLTSEMDELLDHFKVVQEIKPSKSSHAKGRGAAGIVSRDSAKYRAESRTTIGSSFYMHDLKNDMRDDNVVACDPNVTEAIRKEFTKSEGKHLTAPKSIK